MKYLFLLMIYGITGSVSAAESTIYSCNHGSLQVVRTDSVDLHWLRINDPGIASYIANETVTEECPSIGGDYTCWEIQTGALKIAVSSDDRYLQRFYWVNSKQVFPRMDQRLAMFTAYRYDTGLKLELLSRHSRTFRYECEYPYNNSNSCYYVPVDTPAPEIQYRNWYFDRCQDLSRH